MSFYSLGLYWLNIAIAPLSNRAHVHIEQEGDHDALSVLIFLLSSGKRSSILVCRTGNFLVKNVLFQYSGKV